MRTFSRLIICFFPLGLTPLLGYLLEAGYVNLGGGEKDILLLIPWLIWSLVFSIIFIIYWIKKKTLKTIILFATIGATALLLITGLGLFIFTTWVFDYVALGCLAGIFIFGYLWKKASPKTLYLDSDSDPVSWKSIFGLLWLMCLVTLIAYQCSEA